MDRRAFEWRMPVAVTFGEGCVDALAAELGERGAVVMSFAPARQVGLQARLAGALGERLLAWTGVPEGMATLAMARSVAHDVWPVLKRHPTAVLVGLGGGSVLDIAKLLRCRPPDDAGFDALVAALRGRAAWPALQLAPLWLVPTTAGTGSEVTRWATLWDTDAEVALERSFDEPFGFADRAFVDPALSLSCPREVTRDTALDALAHALESIWNHHANPVSDALAVSAARRIIATLPLVLAQPRGLEHRHELSLAALEAGLAFAQTRTALAHALSYELTLEQGMPHGRACALWLSTAWRMAAGRDAHVDALLSRVFDWDAGEGAAMLACWLEHVGAFSEPEQAGIDDVQARVDRALGSSRGRNFVAAR
jgi:phosphonate metabolism-associated iron-containing alcohol dehydrogenase